MPQIRERLYIMAYSSSEEDDFFDAFRAHFSSLLPPNFSVAEALIHSSNNQERVERWKLIAPCFRSLRYRFSVLCMLPYLFQVFNV